MRSGSFKFAALSNASLPPPPICSHRKDSILFLISGPVWVGSHFTWIGLRPCWRINDAGGLHGHFTSHGPLLSLPSLLNHFSIYLCISEILPRTSLLPRDMVNWRMPPAKWLSPWWGPSPLLTPATLRLQALDLPQPQGDFSLDSGVQRAYRCI